MWLWRPFLPSEIRPEVSSKPSTGGAAEDLSQSSVANQIGWDPGRWGSRLDFVPRILNLAKDKASLVTESDGTAITGRHTAHAQQASGGHKDEPRRFVVWSADLHIGPVGDVKELLRGHGVLVSPVRLLT
jgi:hypothetical protein